MRRARLVLAAGLALLARNARAAEGDPLRDHRFDLDVFHGPVLSSSRITSLGGAYVAVAEGVDGLFFNPAAVANRYPFSIDWWDWDLDVGVVFPTAVGGLDFDNDGTVQEYASALTGTAGGSLQFERFGLGLEAALLAYGLSVAGETPTQINLSTLHIDAAYGLFRGELVVGAGLRTASLEVPGIGKIETEGALEAGLLWRPETLPFRLGASARLPIASARNDFLVEEVGGEVTPMACDSTTPVDVAGDDDPSNDVYVPCHLVIPWEVSVGASYRFGRAAYNEPWVDPHVYRSEIRARHNQARLERKRARAEALEGLDPAARAQRHAELLAEEEALREREEDEEDRLLDEAEARREAEYLSRPRRYLLVTASLTVTGPARDAIGLEAFLVQRERRSGVSSSFTPALGVESEVWAHHLRLRAGSYLEPARGIDSAERDVEPRIHGTTGFDLRLFEWDVFGIFDPFYFKLGGMLDRAPKYTNFSVGIGIWH